MSLRDDETRSGSFEGLFSGEWPKVARIAQRILGDQGRAEEVAQDVFLAFYQRFGGDIPSAPGPWLYAAAAHAALNTLRGDGRRQRREESDVRASVTTAPDPALVAEAAEDRRELRQALRRLKPQSAKLLALRYSGLSYNEIAQTLELPVAQVGTRLRRAEMQLRKEMQHEARQ